MEMQMLGWVTLLFMIGWLPGSIAKTQVWGIGWLMGNRATESLPPLTGWQGRAVRSHENFKENYPAFAVAVLLLVAAGQAGNETAGTAAMVFLGARIAHMVFYIGGVPIIRTLAWATGWVATLVILLQVVG